jgi:hypothetical protein
MRGPSPEKRRKNLLNENFRDMLFALSDADAEFMVIGALAMSAHGFTRNTGDLDIWIRRDSTNAGKVWKALRVFQAPLAEISRDDFNTPDIVYQIGVVPYRIDLLTTIDGVEFDEAWPDRASLDVEGRKIPVIGLQALIDNKRACGRPKDIADVQKLEKIRGQK